MIFKISPAPKIPPPPRPPWTHQDPPGPHWDTPRIPPRTPQDHPSPPGPPKDRSRHRGRRWGTVIRSHIKHHTQIRGGRERLQIQVLPLRLPLIFITENNKKILKGRLRAGPTFYPKCGKGAPPRLKGTPTPPLKGTPPRLKGTPTPLKGTQPRLKGTPTPLKGTPPCLKGPHHTVRRGAAGLLSRLRPGPARLGLPPHEHPGGRAGHQGYS